MNDELRMICHVNLDGRDAEPFAGGGLLAVASGQDGTVLDLAPQQAWDIFCKTVLLDCDPSQHNWLKEHFFDRWQQSDKPVTHAAIASRTALVQLLYALLELPGYLENLDEPDARASLTEFVKEGYKRTSEAFFKKTDAPVLATSVAAASVFCDGEDGSADILYAGNASFWVWTQRGLGQIALGQKDHFSGHPNDAFEFCRAKLAPPCVVLAATDGAIGNYAPHQRLGFESLLLDALKHSDSFAMWQELTQALAEQEFHTDASFALTAVGFSSLEAIKAYFDERAKTVCALWNRVKVNFEKSMPPKSENALLKEALRAQIGNSFASLSAILVHTYLENIPDFMVRDVGEPFLTRYIDRKRDAFLSQKANTQQALRAIKEIICDAQNCHDIAKSILRETRGTGLDATMAAAFDSLKTAADALASAKDAFDECCRRQSNLVAEEREVIGLIAKRRTFIQKERDKNARERDENAERQGELYHYQMVKMNEKIVWATKEQARLNEQYRQSCNPVNCRFCDPRCVHYATRDNALSKEIRTRTAEKDNYLASYYALRDSYARLKSEYAQLESKDQVLEREDLELVRLMHAYESGHEVRAGEFSSGSARRFCERLVNQQRSRKQVTRSMEETEKALTEKEFLYQNAVKAFFYSEQQVEFHAERLFRSELLKSLGYEGVSGEFVFARNVDVLTSALREEFLRDESLSKDEIIQSLMQNFESHSVVDPCFDSATLQRFRILCRDVVDNPPTEQELLAEELDAYNGNV